MPNTVHPKIETWKTEGYRFRAVSGYREFQALQIPWEDEIALKKDTAYLVKNTRSRTVVNLEPGQFGAPEFLFVKRYRYKSWHGPWLNLMKQSRVREEWDLAYQLLDKKIPTPAPVWMAEEDRTPSRWCLIATQDLRGTSSCVDRWRARKNEQEGRAILESAGQFLSQMHEARFLHDDGKAEHYRIKAGAPSRDSFYVLDLLGGKFKKLTAGDRTLNLYQFLRSFYPEKEKLDFKPADRQAFLNGYDAKQAAPWDERVKKLGAKKGRLI